MNIQVLISITIYMLAMLWIGYYAYKRTSNLEDFMLGGRGLGPAVAALSAGATDMSGWLLMGLPGAMYVAGISSGWIVIGLCLGAYANWLYVAPRLRIYSEVAGNSMTISSFLENRFKDTSHMLRLISGIVILFFFTFYISSAFAAGAVMFESTFNTSYLIGITVVAVVTIAYTLFGGFLGVSWTDVVQGMIMFLALILVPLVTLFHVGGVEQAFTDIRSINPDYLDFFKGTTVVGIISLFAWGLGYFGQPHIIVRFMAITSATEVKKARRIGISWMLFSMVGAMFTGLIGISYYHQNGLTIADPETIFIKLSEILFHPFITGFLLAAIIAAIMSTISSQLIVTSSALTEDIYRTYFRRKASDKELVFFGRGMVLIVAAIAIALAMNKDSTILALVGYAWAGLGSAFGPVILLSLFWKRMTKWGALAGMITGSLVVFIWPQIEAVNSLYEMVPGFLSAKLAIIIVSLRTPMVKGVAEEFEKSEKLLYDH